MLNNNNNNNNNNNLFILDYIKTLNALTKIVITQDQGSFTLINFNVKAKQKKQDLHA